MTAPDDITPEEIAAIEARCDAANAKLARAVKLLRELDWTENHQITSLRADLAAARAQIEALTKDLETLTHECLVAHEKVSLAMIEEQKWRDSFFAVVAKRDAMRLALSAVAGDPCDEPYMDGRAPCGCCRSHIKTARRALDEG